MSNRRVVVTSQGCVTAAGLTTEATWESLIAGRSAVSAISAFDTSDFTTRIAAEIKDYVAATSVGILEGKKILDLDYSEDSMAEVDMNIVKTGGGGFVEIQGTGERNSFSDKDLAALLSLAHKGIKELIVLQKKAIGTLT